MKYLVCPGPVPSKNDKDWHHISAAALIRLYELRPGEYVIRGQHQGYDLATLMPLYPSYHGHYGRPDSPSEIQGEASSEPGSV